MMSQLERLCDDDIRSGAEIRPGWAGPGRAAGGGSAIEAIARAARGATWEAPHPRSERWLREKS